MRKTYISPGGIFPQLNNRFYALHSSRSIHLLRVYLFRRAMIKKDPSLQDSVAKACNRSHGASSIMARHGCFNALEKYCSEAAKATSAMHRRAHD